MTLPTSVATTSSSRSRRGGLRNRALGGTCRSAKRKPQVAGFSGMVPNTWPFGSSLAIVSEMLEARDVTLSGVLDGRHVVACG